jgi:hypothetical protein
MSKSSEQAYTGPGPAGKLMFFYFLTQVKDNGKQD